VPLALKQGALIDSGHDRHILDSISNLPKQRSLPSTNATPRGRASVVGSSANPKKGHYHPAPGGEAGAARRYSGHLELPSGEAEPYPEAGPC
jgi:hypothetical protein